MKREPSGCPRLRSPTLLLLYLHSKLSLLIDFNGISTRLGLFYIKAYNEMNRLHVSIRLKYKVNSQFLKSPSFLPKVFRSWFDPKHRYKTMVHKSSRHPGLLLERIVTRHVSDKIKDRWHPTNLHHNQHTTQSSLQHFHHKTKVVHCLPTHTTPTVPHATKPASQIQLTPIHLLTLIC